MLKLLITAICWLVVSGGLTGVSAWIAAPEPTAEAPAAAADVYCKNGNWPDRARACAVDRRPPLLSNKSEPAETASDFARLEAHIAAPLAYGSVRFYDASREAAEPVAAPAHTLSGTTTAGPMPMARAVSAEPVSTVVLDERLPAAAAPLPKAERRATVYRPARRRSRESHRRFANNGSAGMPTMRIYGVAF